MSLRDFVFSEAFPNLKAIGFNQYSMQGMNQRYTYASYSDIVGIEAICKEIEVNFEDLVQTSVETEMQSNYTPTVPYVTTEVDPYQQYQYGEIYSPGMTYNSPRVGCNQSDDVEIINNQQQTYRHRTDFSKRQRRKHTEMERIYDCDFEGCDKAYESISHLNTHREKKKHGDKKSIYDFENK